MFGGDRSTSGSCLRKHPVFDGSGFCALTSLSISLEWRCAEGSGTAEGEERWCRARSAFAVVAVGMWYGGKDEPNWGARDLYG